MIKNYFCFRPIISEHEVKPQTKYLFCSIKGRPFALPFNPQKSHPTFFNEKAVIGLAIIRYLDPFASSTFYRTRLCQKFISSLCVKRRTFKTYLKVFAKPEEVNGFSSVAYSLINYVEGYGSNRR